MKEARLKKPHRGYTSIMVDLDSMSGGYKGYQYSCIVKDSGEEILCYEDEFDWI